MSSSITDPAVNAPPAPPKPPDQAKTFAAAPIDDDAHMTKLKGRRTVALKSWQIAFASVILFLWLNLFAGGMLIDTRPYRCVISWAGVKDVTSETIQSHPCQAYWPALEGHRFFDRQALPVAGAAAAGSREATLVPVGLTVVLTAWVITILFYTPLNLAFISAAAGVLGSLGSLVDLNEDRELEAAVIADRTNPLLSGLLRGMFVYLFVISGMLLFDDSPFSATSPDQYVRLAGFLSLFGFVVSYRPYIFGTLIDWAHTRIHSRNGAGGGITRGTKGEVEMKVPPGGEAELINRTISETRAVIESPDATSQPTAGKTDKSLGNGHSSDSKPREFGG